MVSETLIQNSVAIGIVSILGIALILPKKIKFITNGIVLTILGILPILQEMGKITFNPIEIPVFQYVLMILIIFCGRELISEGVRERMMALKLTSIILGIVLISMTTIPALHNLGAISFTLPEIPQLILSIIYIISGLFLAGGSFIFLREQE